MPRAFDTFRVSAKLPPELTPLSELAYNLHWTWDHDCIDLFRRLDRDLWNQSHHNPVKMLGMVSQDKLSQSASDEGFLAHMRRSQDALHSYLQETTWFESRYGKVESPKIAYFSMEYGLTECLPIYSGGLGILAGDHLKSASELGLPLVGVGLLYQQGYFQQYLNADGWQQETYPNNDFYNMPIKLETDANGSPLMVTVEFPGRLVHSQIWRAEVGRVKLYLLDTNVEINQNRDRKIANQLYGGDSEARIQQEMVLGIGGMRALRRIGLHVHVCHMNEGHAAFMAFERIRHRMANDSLTKTEALEVVKGGTIFTTHTPVPAGIDVFDPGLVERYMGHFFSQLDMTKDEFMAFGRSNPLDHNEQLNMALLALRTTSAANGVSELHGAVSRKMWRHIWPNVPPEEVPIGHVTNGIHAHSWISKEMAELFMRYLGPNWLRKPADSSVWARIEKMPDLELWRVHERRRERLVAFTRYRLIQQLKRRGASAKEIDKAAEALNPEVLTIGFARRFATYKRATLILRDPDRLKKILTDPERPVQIIIAGKAHPRDNAGKELIKQLVHFARDRQLQDRLLFVENYDITLARYLVGGVDLWLNNPRRPYEASGTSGMKLVPNGGLNLSVLDGWWCEGYDQDTGWVIGSGEEYNDHGYQDEVESKNLYDVLESQVVPTFYDRGGDGLPRRWIAKMKRSMMKLGPMFNTNRMVGEYTDKFYMRAYDNWKRLSVRDFSVAKDLIKWKRKVEAHWKSVKVVSASIEQKEVRVGYALKVSAKLDLGALGRESVVVQVYSGSLGVDGEIESRAVDEMKWAETTSDGKDLYEGFIPLGTSGMFGYSVRVMPYHPDMVDQFGLEHMTWIDAGHKAL